MVYAELGGQTECIMGNWKIENWCIFGNYSTEKCVLSKGSFLMTSVTVLFSADGS